jgi:uracil-DNA glycosylase
MNNQPRRPHNGHSARCAGYGSEAAGLGPELARADRAVGCTMMRSNMTTWPELIESQRHCRLCATDCGRRVIEEGARPLFGRFRVWKNGVLFLFEAPNWDDTFDAGKGYLTYDSETDPTGRFARRLIKDELGMDPDFFQVTNSVLCLPSKNHGRFPITADQKRLCEPLIREQIRILDPTVVVPVGGAALEFTRRLERHPYRTMGEAAARPRQWFGRWLFPLFHTSMLARNGPTGRTEQHQREDWRALRKFLDEKGIPVPAA